jgi:alkanesulfonate monooxygenase SsuD/methylene tetrahydromethanopterin reductase-like flavin-dependent oxidoreductase (luciferase family)
MSARAVGTIARDYGKDTLEGWTTLAAMALVVTRVRIGCLVTGVTYRHPAVLAKMAVTVDHISGGRLEFGLGAAWHEAEHRGYGIPFPRAGERIAMVYEALRAIKALWTEDSASFEGKYFRLDGRSAIRSLSRSRTRRRARREVVADHGDARRRMERDQF